MNNWPDATEVENEIVQAYLACAIWSSHDWNDTDENDNPTPMDENYTVDDFAPEAVKQAREDISDFISIEGNVYWLKNWEPTQFAHDFWLSRNGHGAGFFDRTHLPGHRELQEAARNYGSTDPYVGDDGLIYFS